MNAIDFVLRVEQSAKEFDEFRVLQLAAISTAALQNTEASVRDRIDRDNVYWTAAYGDVCKAVDREMALRAENAKLRYNLDRAGPNPERDFVEEANRLLAAKDKEIARLKEEVATLISPRAKNIEVSFWYMHDNHTFTRIYGTCLDGIVVKAVEIEASSSCGMLCAPIIVRDGKEERPDLPNAHSHGKFNPQYFKDELTTWRRAVEAHGEIMDFINKGKATWDWATTR
jgi:hypothetical protein